MRVIADNHMTLWHICELPNSQVNRYFKPTAALC